MTNKSALHPAPKQTSQKPNVVALVLGARHNFWLDQRVRRTAGALASGGYEIIAYTPVKSRESSGASPGVTVRYIVPPGGNNKLFRKLLLDYLLYNIPVAIDMKRNRVNICHCNDFDTLPGGVLLKLLTLGRAKLVYDSHEDYPLFVGEERGKLLAKLIGVIETVFSRLFVDLSITVNKTIKTKFEKMGLRSEVIFNCQDLSAEETGFSHRIPADETDWFRVAYQGNIIRQRGYEQLIEAADILVHQRKLEKLKIIIIGKSLSDESYGKYIEGLINNKELKEHFLFTGFVSHGEMMEMLRHVDAGLILFQPTPNNLKGLPNKLFENFAAGIPTIASNFPEMAGIIGEEKCGLLVDPTQPGAIADAVEYLYANPGVRLQMANNALQAAQEKYNFPRQSEKLLAAYRDVFG
jgi:glycosyltransferase involved in cell wall biosynthesis